MLAESAPLHDRLSELVAYLSGSPQILARCAVEQSMDEHEDADALRHVATALIQLRRSDHRELAGARA